MAADIAGGTGRRPTALFVAWRGASAVVRHLHAARTRCREAAVDVEVQDPCLSDIPRSVRSQVDLVIFDGHGYLPAAPAARIRDADRHGIIAPVLVLGACYSAREPFIRALRTCLDLPQTAFLGCDRPAAFNDAELVFPDVVDVLAELGPSPAPADFCARLSARRLGEKAPGWGTQILTPLPA